MRHQDFGRLDDPIVLFGGAYSNLAAITAFFKAAGPREVISTGDLVGYCADPVSTVAFYHHEDVWGGVAGNCERQLTENADDCGCGFEENTTCDLLSAAWYPFLKEQATPDVIATLEALPDIGSFVHAGKRYAVIHGGATAINRFVWPCSPDTVFTEEFAAIEAAIGPVDGVIAGHCGLAFQRVIGQHHWINPGAIGLPPHDGRPETRYGVLQNGEVVFHRLSYDHASARDRMIEAGLTQGYHDTLVTGIWPSEDVLPPELRR